jgi:pyruvate/2-oxoglutarate dehydrogenase complex dihydrolipoamide dehydrogenase (E3) component
VNGRQLSAPRIFLNVGGRSVRPELAGIDSVTTLDNVSIMELETVPGHLVIVGAATSGWSSRT